MREGSLLLLIIYAIPIIGIIAAIYFHKKANSKPNTNNNIPTKPIPQTFQQQPQHTHENYQNAYKREYLMTANERRQYWNLRRWADTKNLIVFTKVRLADLISPRNSQNQKLFWKIQAKHIDFVVCDQNINVRCIVELQDSSHNRPDRIERDKFVREVLEACGYKVIQTFGVDNELLDRVCGYYKPETEIRHDAEGVTANETGETYQS